MTALRLFIVALLVGIVAEVPFLLDPQLDLEASGLFYLGGNRFLLTDNLAYRYFNDWIRPIARVFAVLMLAWAVWLMVRRPERRGLYLRRTIFIVVAFGLGPALIVDGVLKSHWGRARPKDVVEFGGDRTFTPPFVITDQCDKNCSFVSGDAAAVFAFAAFALLSRRRRGLWLAVTIGAGAAMGALRIALGAHFLSDVIFAGVICVSISAACYWLLFERPSAARPPP